jgi:hypothetical protein
MPETELPNGGDHELWNHEMRGSPFFMVIVVVKSSWNINYLKSAPNKF